jgi:DNA-binding FadR family transcriptional regulator
MMAVMTTPGRRTTVDTTDVAFRPIRSGNAFEECVERVLSAVKLGLVPVGERLPAERDLAARLGVSRVTLREALRSLADAGWLEVRRGRHGGTFVLHRPAPPARGGRRRVPPPAALEDTLVLREVLEVGAVGLAASGPRRPDALDALGDALADCRAAGVERYRTADSRFHLAVSELTGSPSLVAAAADVRMRVNDLLDAIPLLERNLAHSNDQHDRIVRAIRRGQPAAARAAMEEHLAGTAALLRGFLS